METTPAIAPPTQTAPKEPQVGVPVQAQLDTAQQAGREKKSGQVLQSCRGAHAAASATMLRQLVYDHLGTHPDQDGFTLVTHCKGKTQKKWKPGSEKLQMVRAGEKMRACLMSWKKSLMGLIHHRSA